MLAVLLLPLFTFSQRVDLDRFKFTCQYRTLPAARLDSSYHTYDVAVEGTKLMQSYLDDLSPEKSVILNGWKMLEDDGHITVQVKLEDLLPESFSVKERVETSTDRSGKATTRKLYAQEVVYTFSAFADIVDYKGAQLEHIILADRGYKQVYRSPEFANRQIAAGYFMINTLTVTEQLYRSCISRAMRYLSGQLTDNFGYGETTVTDQMWIIDTKKHPEYAAHRNAFLTLKDVLFGITADKPLDDVRVQLQPVISYFEGIKKKYTSMNKYDRKIRYASYYNLAVLYYYLDDPQAMLKEASGLVLNDFDARDGKKFEETAIWLKNLFEDTRIYSRHFAIDTSSFKGPNEVVAVK